MINTRTEQLREELKNNKKFKEAVKFFIDRLPLEIKEEIYKQAAAQKIIDSSYNGFNPLKEFKVGSQQEFLTKLLNPLFYREGGETQFFSNKYLNY